MLVAEIDTNAAQKRLAVSVVIATRDRPELLRRCLGYVLAQKVQDRDFEVIVVNDGKELPAMGTLVDQCVRVITSGQVGPALARNKGVEAAKGSIILFTDDDTIVTPEWLESAAQALETTSDAVGAEGPTDGGEYDQLYEHSVHNKNSGAYYTCNVAYRRVDLLALEGFDASFPYAHCEDVDLGLRMAARGKVVFVSAMRVLHPPRTVSFWELARRARLIESEWQLYRKHPQRQRGTYSVRWTPAIGVARWWYRCWSVQALRAGGLRWLTRYFAVAAIQACIALYITIIRWRSVERNRPPGRTDTAESREDNG